MTTRKGDTVKKTRKPRAKKSDTVLVLRTCNADMTSHGGFKWPESGPVEAPDWNGKPECGGGLHGLLWGAGDGALLNWEPDARWLVVEVAQFVDIDGQKIKFQRGIVKYAGVRDEAIKMVAASAPEKTAIVGHAATAGDRGSATAGYRGSATAGDGGSATAGDGGSATAGDGGSATGGDSCVLLIGWWDGDRYRRAFAEVDGEKIKAGVKYRLNDAHEFEEVKP